jgi:hypothetical protein
MRFGSRLANSKYTIDFAGRRIVDDKQMIDMKNFDIESTDDSKENTNPVVKSECQIQRNYSAPKVTLLQFKHSLFK